MRSYYLYVFLLALVCTLWRSPRAEAITILPSQSCASTWEGKSLRQTQFDPLQDADYRAYQNRLRAKSWHREKCNKPWTILISMMVSPDLEKYAIADLLQLEKQIEGSAFQADVIIQIEEQQSRRVRRYHLLQNSTSTPTPNTSQELSQLSFDQLQSPIISEYYAHALIPARKRFANFVRWGVQDYPSENLMLVFWGHGRGWQTLSELNLRATLAKIQCWRKKPLDVLAWDACFMQSLEDAVEVAPWTRFVCGSEDIESCAGYDYTDLVQAITQSQSHSPDPALHVAASIPTLYERSFDSTSGTQTRLDPRITETLTGSTLKSQEVLENLVPALNQLAQELQDWTQQSDTWQSVKLIIEKSPTYAGGTRDLGLFLMDLLKTIEMIGLKKSSRDAVYLTELIEHTCMVLNQSVLRTVLGNKYTFPEDRQICQASGVSIFLPRTSSEFHEQIKLLSRSGLYLSHPFFRVRSPWAEWVRSMYR